MIYEPKWNVLLTKADKYSPIPMNSTMIPNFFSIIIIFLVMNKISEKIIYSLYLS